MLVSEQVLQIRDPKAFGSLDGGDDVLLYLGWDACKNKSRWDGVLATKVDGIRSLHMSNVEGCCCSILFDVFGTLGPGIVNAFLASYCVQRKAIEKK